jgi:hypothetical protein
LHFGEYERKSEIGVSGHFLDPYLAARDEMEKERKVER